ncbi:MAG TPA: branched-chain amino acid ABC transporter substrate-binding protein [Acidimicrobiales bacterium]|nr:branched-chain amino acid ABC transporter substrate-binding protein [Acidimicrobiales bacterium]
MAAAVAASALSLGAVAAPATAASKPNFTIAFEGPLTVNSPQLGLNVLYAVELAIDQANAGKTFGNLPFTLSFVKKDDQGSATISPTTAQELVSDPSVIGVVGPMFSGATKAAEPTFSAHNLATVSPSATNPALATSGWHNFFRDVAGDNIQGPSDANYVVKTMHYTNIMVVSDASTYGAGLAGAFAGQAKKDGVKVTTGTFPGTTQCGDGNGSPTQYPDDAATVVNAKPQILFYGGYYCDLGLLLGALHKAGYTGKVMSGDGSESDALVSSTNPQSAANGVYASCPCAVVGNTSADKAFSAGFSKLAHFAPAIYSPEGYDATNVIIDAMKILASGKSGTMAITRLNVVNELHKISYVGITKTVSFLPDGNINGGAIYIYQVKNGKFVELGLE